MLPFLSLICPPNVQRKAIPAIYDRLDQARSFDIVPLVGTLLSAAFPRCDEAITELTYLQKHILARLVNTEELWSIGNLMWTFQEYGLSHDREKCANLVGTQIANDEALTKLRSALAFADIGFLEKAREGIFKALEADPAVFERASAADECWLLYAKAFAESDPARAIAAFRRACSINPDVAHRINSSWRLTELLKENGLV